MLKLRITVAMIAAVSVAMAASSFTASSSGPRTQTNASRESDKKALINTVELAALKAQARGQAFRTLSLNVERRGHTATTLSDGRVLIAGGENNNGPVADIEVIDAVSGAATLIGKLGFARTHHTATTLADGRIMIAGGSNGPRSLSSTEVFDPQTDSISSGPQLNRARSGHSATLLAGGKVLIVGGRSDQSAEIFDPNTERFALLDAATLAPHVDHSTLRLSDGSVLVAGGKTAQGKPADSAEVFNPLTSSFEEIQGWMMAARIRPEMIQLPDGKVQIIGGDKAGSMEMYDPNQRIFRSSAPLPLTADMLPTATILLARTRKAYLDNAYARSQKTINKNTSPEAPSAGDGTPLNITDYSVTEISGSNIVVVAGGMDAAGNTVSSVLITQDNQAASLTTDHIEYAPDQSPLIGGSGWAPGEHIVIVRQEAAGDRGRILLRAKADGKGNFANSSLTPADHEVSAYILTAIGQQSGYVAQTTYRSAPAADPKYAGRKPVKLSFKMPVTGKPGSMDTEAGPLTWAPKNEGGASKQAGLVPEGQDVSGSASLTGCLHLGFVDLCGQTSLEIKQSHFQMQMNLNVDLHFGFNPLPFFSAGASFDQSLDAGITFILSGSGTITAGDIVVPLIPTIEFSVGPISGELKCGLFLGVELGLEPTTIQFDVSLKDKVDVGASLSSDTGFTETKNVTSASANGSVQIIKLGAVTLKVFCGPDAEVGLDLDVAHAKVGAIIDGFIQGGIDATLTKTCTKFTETIDGGFEASITGSVGLNLGALGSPSLDGTASAELFRANIATFSQTLADTDPPTISQSDIIVSTPQGKCAQTVNYTPTVTDSCSGVANVACVPPSGSVFQKGVTKVTCTAVDNKGNTAISSFNVTVVDNQPPAFTGTPPNVTHSTDSGTCSAVVTFATPVATDACQGTVPVVCVPASGSTFPKGMTVVHCTATNNDQITANTSFTVTIADNEKPTVVSAPEVFAIAPPGATSAAVSFAPVVTDNCPGLHVVLLPASGSVFPLGTTTVNGTATDAVGNVTTFSFKVNVFNLLAVDDSTGAVFHAIWNGGSTAQYEYFNCSKNIHLTGTMRVTVTGCKVEGTDKGADPKRPDRNVDMVFNTCGFSASGFVQIGAMKFTIIDADVRTATISCL
jgi:hypothetical protein